MALYAVIYRYVDDTEALDEHRPAHRDFLRPLFEQGRLVASGPLVEDSVTGALLIFEADGADEVAALLDDDPFRVEGLITEREVRRWDPAFGGDRLTAAT